MRTDAPLPAYHPDTRRYDRLTYRRCGRSGLKLPPLSLGLWHNFGGIDSLETARAMLRRAFDLGITHFDLANNYGPPYGSAETTFGRLLKEDFRAHRDELVVSTKAGYDMWPGPYGIGGSRKHLMASLDQSLWRMGLEYVDIFYHHCPDPDTPLEETVATLDHMVRAGKARYVGISSYSPERTADTARLLRDMGTPLLIHQPRYSMLDRGPETSGLFNTLRREGLGAIVFSPLEQGILTDKYLAGIPERSRAARHEQVHLSSDDVTARIEKARALNEIATARGQRLAQMALSWVMRDEVVTSALIGASRPEQIEQCIGALEAAPFGEEELARIDAILGS
ncbi:L-glyceraldehyde 3-phosphate reductase [Halomonas nitroreducens]|uniref:L-glyceraldehyde 3-phosphate reductase n=1 Tax=Halomonas nitroreducens TaxID=447425 RepID=A0A3S0J9K3_9GAMM|nr:L-glyceraldehyde 3-phosphate reductase [Halomonas nitroreducens]RTR02970.1 L-glyceraldehyde 3-phosphate reductase [Halomonas nitroreducens]